jgi:hypothetical protein
MSVVTVNTILTSYRCYVHNHSDYESQNGYEHILSSFVGSVRQYRHIVLAVFL